MTDDEAIEFYIEWYETITEHKGYGLSYFEESVSDACKTNGITREQEEKAKEHWSEYIWKVR
jgi:hypothetical protein